MKKRKLNYCFHNPNTVEATADVLLKVFIEANSKKVENAIQEVAGQVADSKGYDEENQHSIMLDKILKKYNGTNIKPELFMKS